MIESDQKVGGQYRLKNLAIDEAIDIVMLLGLDQETTGVEMAKHIVAVDLEFPSYCNILTHPNVILGDTDALVTTPKTK